MLLSLPRPLFALALVAAATTRAEVEFVGVLVTPARTLYALTDDPAKPSAWRALGQEFAGGKLTNFDEKTNTLTLVKDGTELQLRLKDDAKAGATRFQLTGSVTFAHGEKIEVRRVTLALDETTTFPLTDDLTCSITPQSRAPRIYTREGMTSCLVVLSKSGDHGWLRRSAIAWRPDEPLEIKIDDHEFPQPQKSN